MNAMTVCNYIDQLYQIVIDSYNGITPDYSTLTINGDVISTAIAPTITDNTLTTNCELTVNTNACSLQITLI